MQNEYKVHEGQTLFDIAIHNYGSIEAAFELAASLNQGLTDPLIAGILIELPQNIPAPWINRYITAAIHNRNLVPRTAPKVVGEPKD